MVEKGIILHKITDILEKEGPRQPNLLLFSIWAHALAMPETPYKYVSRGHYKFSYKLSTL